MYPALETSEDELHSDLEEKAKEKGRGKMVVMKDEDRKPRSDEEMEKEAAWLKTFFQKSNL
jgi:bis(5'-adenosyl)-triphosphatase